MSRINEQRRRDLLEGRKHQRTIAENGVKPVEQLEVDAAFVAVAHAIEKAEIAFQQTGDVREPASQIQEEALRKIRLEEARCKYFVDRQDAAEDAKRREHDVALAKSASRASWAQVGLAVAVTVATIVQTTVAVLAYKKEAATETPPAAAVKVQAPHAR